MLIEEMVRDAKRVYIVGNGGSYANAVHIVNDLLSCGIKAHALDPATLTAFANDHGYETVFERWLLVVGEPGDLLIALSGSGRSPNIVRALETARAMEMKTLLLTGAYEEQPKAASLADHVLRYGDTMQSAEEAQVFTWHQLMRRIK